MTKRSSIRSTAKRAERDVAEILGGYRLAAGVWEGPGDVDVASHKRLEDSWFYVQVKHRPWSTMVREGLKQITKSCAGTDKLPLLVLVDKAGQGVKGDVLVCMRVEDFVLWNGRGDV